MEQIFDNKMPEIHCPQGNKARMICVSSKCSKNGLICMKVDCKICQSNHKTCLHKKLETLIKQLNNKLQAPSSEKIKGYSLIKDCLDEAIERLTNDKYQIENQMQFEGLNGHEALFYKNCKQNKLTDINGSITFKAVQNITQKYQRNLKESFVTQYWKQKQKFFSKIFDNFQKLGPKYIEIDSQITQEVDIIMQFFTKQIQKFVLLYRANEHGFLVSEFHRYCDGISNTLVLAQTQFGKIIGAFTSLAWSTFQAFVDDTTVFEPSFLFSVSINQKYQVIARNEAIYTGNSYGPTFGAGHDFYISDNSRQSRDNSHFSFPTSYNRMKAPYTPGVQSYSAFSGSTTQYARVLNWEVFRVQFKQ